MTPIQNYKILSGFCEDLETLVNEHLSAGWELLGPPTRDQYGCFYQAMVRQTLNIRYPLNVETRTDQLK